MIGRARYWAAALTVAAVVVVGGIAAAQIAEAEGGARAEAGLDFRLELDDGAPEFRTGFDLDLITATRTRRLSFSGNFGVVVPLNDIDAVQFDEPGYGISYLSDTGRTRLNVGAGLFRRNLDDDFLRGAGFDEELLTLDGGGFEEGRSVEATLEIGMNNHVGVALLYSIDSTTFAELADPRLLDFQRHEAAVAIRYDVDESLHLGAGAQWTLHDEARGLGSERDERFRAGVEAMWQLRPELGLSAEIAYARLQLETETATGIGLDERDGMNLRFGVDLDRPNGDIGFNAARILHAPGFVNTVDLSSSFELPRGAQVRVVLGAAQLPSGGIHSTGTFNYDRELRQGDLAFSYSQSAALNSDFDEVYRRILESSYRLDLSHEASLSITGTLTDSDFLQGVHADVDSAQLTINYRRPLTPTWNIGAGASWQLVQEAGANDDVSRRVFLGLERQITLRH